MKTRRSFAAYLLTLFTVGCALGYAQQPPGVSTSPPAARYTDWTILRRQVTGWHGKLLLIPVAHPGKGIACSVSRITDDAIACHHALQQDTVYDRETIAAVLSPAYHPVPSWVPGGLYFAGAAGAAFFGNFFGVAVLAASIPLWFLAIALLFNVFIADSETEPSRPEVLLYQRPSSLPLHSETHN